MRSYFLSVFVEERAAVVDVRRDARVLVRLVGIVRLAEVEQRRVDLDGVDVLRRRASSAIATSVPVPAPTISTLLRLLGTPLVRLVVERLLREAGLRVVSRWCGMPLT